MPPNGSAAAGDRERYPHIEWEGVLCDDGRDGGDAAAVENAVPQQPIEDAAPSALAGALALAGPLASPPARAAEAASQALSSGQYARLALIAPLALVLIPIWLAVAPSLLLTLGLAKRHTRRARPLPPALSRLLPADGDADVGSTPAATSCAWPDALLGDAAARAAPQAWMAAQLNTLRWHKVSVRFSVARDGLSAVHTHGHVVVRRENTNKCGMDVLTHVADTLVHTEPPAC